MLELVKNVFATDDGLGIYLPDLRTICIADLHIGIELAFLGEGTYLPIDQFQIIHKNILKMIKKYKPKKIIINGDFKHEFGRASPQEWYELRELINSLNKFKVDLEIVRGNHDNFLKTILHRYGKDIQEPGYVDSNYLFIHGHQSLEEVYKGMLPDVDWIIMAHEHPAIMLFDEIKGKHKFSCFLYREWEGRNVLVLPAYSPFASGTIMNSPDCDEKELLSPILREISIDEFKPIIIDKNQVLTFPKLVAMSALADFRLDNCQTMCPHY